MIEKLISYLKRHKNMASLNQISILGGLKDVQNLEIVNCFISNISLFNLLTKLRTRVFKGSRLGQQLYMESGIKSRYFRFIILKMEGENAKGIG